MSASKVCSLLALGLLWTSPIPLGAQNPSGPQFQVNSETQGTQRRADAVFLPDGSSVVVWASADSSGDDNLQLSIQGRRFDADGSPIGNDFQINTYTTGDQTRPVIGAADDGTMVVVWQSEGSDANPMGLRVVGRRLAADGSPIGSELAISEVGADFQSIAALSVAPAGDFVVAWQSMEPTGNSYEVLTRRFDATGAPLESPFQVNIFTTGTQEATAVVHQSNGDFLVVWHSEDSLADPGSFSIQGRLYDAASMPLTTELQLNGFTTSAQALPDVGVGPDDGFVVTWSSYGSGGDDVEGLSIQARHFDATLAPVAGEFQVNAVTTGNQAYPSLSVDVSGDFVVAWEDGLYGGGADGSGPGIFARRFAPDATPVGDEYQVNTYTSGDQIEAVVVHDPQGNTSVFWRSQGSTGNDSAATSIQGQRFAPNLFRDGFESGDTSAWDNTIN